MVAAGPTARPPRARLCLPWPRAKAFTADFVVNNPVTCWKFERRRKGKVRRLDDFLLAHPMSMDSNSSVEPKEVTDELPEDVIPLASSEGQRRLGECSSGNGESPSQYSAIGPCFRKQVGSKFCGVASTAIVLSSLPSCDRVEEDQGRRRPAL